MQAAGVQGAKPSAFPMNTPALEMSVMPSTSFRGASRLQISSWSAFRCFGNGRNISTPWILPSALTASMVFRSSALLTSSGSRNFSTATPRVSARLTAPFS